MAPHPEQVFDTIADTPGAVWLDGGSTREGWSILAWKPEVVITDATGWPDAGRSLTRSRAEGTAPFSGGVLGYVGYDAGWVVDRVPPAEPTPEPPVWLARYPGGLCYRHSDQTWHVAGDATFCREAEHLLETAPPSRPPSPVRPARSRSVDASVYAAAIDRILELLEAGDCYQVNLSRAVHVEGAGAAWCGYRRLRALSEASYGAFLRLTPSLVVLSNSPELLLEVRGEHARSRPIKGTRPRGRDPEQDARLARELASSTKDIAELTMIVDLVRNDLGRIGVPGSVYTGSRTLAAHANVHHASQEVTARLAPGIDAWTALAAMFPPGSVTGAPKVRACRRIAELEQEPRGVYCGAIGYVADGGNATWSVAIRTAVQEEDRLRYHVGGGVVIDSDPLDEWAETVAKGRALASALHGAPD